MNACEARGGYEKRGGGGGGAVRFWPDTKSGGGGGGGGCCPLYARCKKRVGEGGAVCFTKSGGGGLLAVR